MRILKCLRCGSTDVEVKEWYCGDSSIPVFRCECENGDCWDNWSDTKEEAIAYWNERPKRNPKEPTLFKVELLEDTAYNSKFDILNIKAVGEDGCVYYYDSMRRWCYLEPNGKWRKV